MNVDTPVISETVREQYNKIFALNNRKKLKKYDYPYVGVGYYVLIKPPKDFAQPIPTNKILVRVVIVYPEYRVDTTDITYKRPPDIGITDLVTGEAHIVSVMDVLGIYRRNGSFKKDNMYANIQPNMYVSSKVYTGQLFDIAGYCLGRMDVEISRTIDPIKLSNIYHKQQLGMIGFDKSTGIIQVRKHVFTKWLQKNINRVLFTRRKLERIAYENDERFKYTGVKDVKPNN